MQFLLHLNGNLNNMKYFKKEYVYFILIGLIVGVLTTLSLRALKYSEYINPNINDIDPNFAHKNITTDPKKYVFIDVRSEYEYKQAHAEGSINLPIHYLYDDTHGLKNEKGIPIPKNTDQTIYLICSGGRLAGVAYGYLEHYGFRNIQRIEGGIKHWNEEGLPIITRDVFDGFKEKSFNAASSTQLDKTLNIPPSPNK